MPFECIYLSPYSKSLSIFLVSLGLNSYLCWIEIFLLWFCHITDHPLATRKQCTKNYQTRRLTLVSLSYGGSGVSWSRFILSSTLSHFINCTRLILKMLLRHTFVYFQFSKRDRQRQSFLSLFSWLAWRLRETPSGSETSAKLIAIIFNRFSGD